MKGELVRYYGRKELLGLGTRKIETGDFRTRANFLSDHRLVESYVRPRSVNDESGRWINTGVEKGRHGRRSNVRLLGGVDECWMYIGRRIVYQHYRHLKSHCFTLQEIFGWIEFREH